MKSYKKVFQEIKNLEMKLLNSQTRKSIDFLSEILADEFIEFGSSGKIYNKQQILESLQNETTPKMLLSDFKAVQLSDEYYHITYKIIKVESKRESYSLRSSVWRFYNNKWQIIFHQGTKIKT